MSIIEEIRTKFEAVNPAQFETSSFYLKPSQEEFKQYRAIATLYDKTARNCLGAIHLAATVIWLN